METDLGSRQEKILQSLEEYQDKGSCYYRRPARRSAFSQLRVLLGRFPLGHGALQAKQAICILCSL